jgi:hypothetical protein
MQTLLKPKGIVIHHSLTKDGKVVDWDAIKRYHMTAPEFMMDDIGYHGGIERVNGEVLTITGRPINKTGGHTKGANDMLGLCIVGNFDLAPPDEEMLKSAAIMCRAWMNMYPHITSKDVYPHHHFASYKSCPGTQFPWDKFIAMVEGSAYVA